MIATLSIMVKSGEAVEKVNALLHDYRDNILGRMGLPIKDKGLSVICLVLETDAAVLNALSGKLGSLEGVKAKALYGLPQE